MGWTGTKFQSEPNRNRRPMLALTNEDLPEMDAQRTESAREMQTRQMPTRLVRVGLPQRDDGNGTAP